MKVKEIDFEVVAFGGIATIGAIVIAFIIYATSMQPKEGYVIRKDYIPAHTKTTYKSVRDSKENVRVPQQEWVDAQYIITIQGKDKNGNDATAMYNVTEQEYAEIQIGDYFIKEKRK